MSPQVGFIEQIHQNLCSLSWLHRYNGSKYDKHIKNEADVLILMAIFWLTSQKISKSSCLMNIGHPARRWRSFTGLWINENHHGKH